MVASTINVSTPIVNQYGPGVLVRDHRSAMNSFVSPTVRRMNKQLWEEMAKLVNENPELRGAVDELVVAKNAMETEQQRRRED